MGVGMPFKGGVLSMGNARLDEEFDRRGWEVPAVTSGREEVRLREAESLSLS